MADFFNKLKKSIDKGTAIVGAKSTTLIETNKIKQDIAASTRLKKDTLLELGKKVYELNNEGTFTIEAVEGLMTKISEAEAKIVDMEAKITLLQDEEKTKMDEINAAAAEDAPVDVAATEVVEPVEAAAEAATEAATEVAEAVKEVAPVAPVAPVAAEVVEEAAETNNNETGEYNG